MLLALTPLWRGSVNLFTHLANRQRHTSVLTIVAGVADTGGLLAITASRDSHAGSKRDALVSTTSRTQIHTPIAAEQGGNVHVHAQLVGIAKAPEAYRRLVAPDFRLENQVTAAADEVYCGETAWREWLDDLRAVFAEHAQYSVEIIDARDECVVAAFAIDGHGIHSGRWIDFRWTAVTWFEDGRAVRTVSYPSTEEALSAVKTREPLPS